jgi:urease accessory protein
VKGGYHLVCGPDTAGRSALVRQYVSAPMHISKPWWQEGLLIVNAINSTAGLFSGDLIDSTIEVKSGAQMLVTSPSASRAYRMPSGNAAVRQSIRVAAGGWLEMLPSHFIPHAGSDYFQETSIHLESAARFLWFETFTPGRVASGEAWQFTRFESRFHLTQDSRPIARETYSLTPDSPSVQALRDRFPAACHATCYAAGADFPDDLLASVSQLHHPKCWIGCTRLDAPAIAIRLVAADNIHLTRALTNIRDLLHRAFNRPVPPLRRAS